MNWFIKTTPVGFWRCSAPKMSTPHHKGWAEMFIGVETQGDRKRLQIITVTWRLLN